MNYIFVCSRLDTMFEKRKQLLTSIVNKKNNVLIISMERHFETELRLQAGGISHMYFPCKRNNISFFLDFYFIFKLIACIKNKNIDCLISYTIKPNVYSGIALFFCKKIKFVPVVTGLGFAFQEGSFVRRLLKNITVWLHRISFRKAHKVIVQNTHNTQFLIEQNIVEKENVILIEGDGVNIPDISEKKFGAKLRFVSLARLLGEKGLRELRDAIYEVKKTYPDFHVELFGPIENSADAISVAEIDAWKREGTLLWKGYCENIDKLFRESDIFTLPSYHEGMSTAVSEAIAYGLPVVGSDIPGIKEMVDRNGYLVAPRKVRPLADALKRMLEASLEDLKYMSMRSRQIAIYKFDRVKIMNEIEKVIA